jgi:hypothetical protein
MARPDSADLAREPAAGPVCRSPIRVIAVIDDPLAVERILSHLGAWHDPRAGLSTPDTPGQ